MLQIVPKAGLVSSMADQTEHPGTGPGAEQRRHRRFPCEGFAEVVSFRPHLLFRGRLRDISHSGCFVETRAHLNLPRMAEVEIRFTVCGLKHAALARVMDVRPGKGAGFEFLPQDPRLDQSFKKVIDGLELTGSPKD
jgi:hypothetical protein